MWRFPRLLLPCAVRVPLAEPCLVVSGGAAAQIAATLRCSATAKQFVGLFIVISKGKHGLAFFAPPTAREAVSASPDPVDADRRRRAFWDDYVGGDEYCTRFDHGYPFQRAVKLPIEKDDGNYSS